MCVCARHTSQSHATLASIQKNSYFVPSQGHIETKSYLVSIIKLCVCVCATHRLGHTTLVFIYINSRACSNCHPVRKEAKYALESVSY